MLNVIFSVYNIQFFFLLFQVCGQALRYTITTTNAQVSILHLST